MWDQLLQQNYKNHKSLFHSFICSFLNRDRISVESKVSSEKALVSPKVVAPGKNPVNLSASITVSPGSGVRYKAVPR